MTSNDTHADNLDDINQSIEIKEEKVETVVRSDELDTYTADGIYFERCEVKNEVNLEYEDTVSSIESVKETKDLLVVGYNNEEGCLEEDSRIKEEDECNNLLTSPGEFQENYAPSSQQDGDRSLATGSDNMFKDAENENSFVASSEFDSSKVSDPLTLIPSDNEMKVEVTPYNYKEIGTVAHVKQEITEYKNDLNNLPVYFINCKPSKEDSNQSSVETPTDHRKTAVDGDAFQLEVITQDVPCESVSKNVEEQNRQAETLSQPTNKARTIRQQLQIERKGKFKERERGNNSSSNSSGEKYPGKKQSMVNESRGKGNTKIPCEDSLSSKIEMKAKTMSKKAGKTSRREKCFECDICGYTSTHRGDFRKHTRKHTGERPFQCKICATNFFQNSLKLHMRTHTGERPFECRICAFKFTQHGHLRRHMKIHTMEKPFKCDICEYQSNRKDMLNMHARIHRKETP